MTVAYPVVQHSCCQSSSLFVSAVVIIIILLIEQVRPFLIALILSVDVKQH